MANLIAISYVKGPGITSDTGRVDTANKITGQFNVAYISKILPATVNGATGSVFTYADPGKQYYDVYESDLTAAAIVALANA